MTLFREQAKCPSCGEPYKEITSNSNIIGDNFIRWDFDSHKCMAGINYNAPKNILSEKELEDIGNYRGDYFDRIMNRVPIWEVHKKEHEFIYEALYCDCVHESSYATLSVHKTKKGAYTAMKQHKVNTYLRWYNDRILYGKDKIYGFPYNFAQNWSIRKVELKS